jgi:hypothetical protein
MKDMLVHLEKLLPSYWPACCPIYSRKIADRYGWQRRSRGFPGSGSICSTMSVYENSGRRFNETR